MKDDMVRVHDNYRGGIKSGSICKVTALTNESDGATNRYVEIRRSELNSDLRPYLDLHHDQPQEFDFYVNSIFMDEKTRIKLYVRTGSEYQFQLSKGKLIGNLIYFFLHPDRYLKLLAWIAIFAFVLAIVGYSLKDWYAEHKPDGTSWTPRNVNGRVMTSVPNEYIYITQIGTDVHWILTTHDPSGNPAFRHEFTGHFTSPSHITGRQNRINLRNNCTVVQLYEIEVPRDYFMDVIWRNAPAADQPLGTIQRDGDFCDLRPDLSDNAEWTIEHAS